MRATTYSASTNVNKGDVVCLVSGGAPPTVQTANSTLLGANPVVGVAASNSSGGTVYVYDSGSVPASITGLGTGPAQPIAVNPGDGKCTRTLGTNLYFVGDCDANGDLELRPRIGNQVLGIATVVVPTGGGTTNLVSTSAGLATGDVAIVEGYSTPGDGGGGQFWFEVGPMNRKIMAAVSSQVSVASTQPNSAVDPLVRVRCSSAHQLVEGQAVTVSGALDGGANGHFIITLAGLGVQATTDFILLGVLARGTFGAGGLVGTTVLTIPGHPYETGQRLVIRDSTWSAGTLDGSYFRIGVVDVNRVTLPAFISGLYTSGGITGDDGLIVPATHGRGVWHRIYDLSSIQTIWFGMPLDGTNDDAPAVMAALAAAGNASLFTSAPRVVLPPSPKGKLAPFFRQTVEISRIVHLTGAGRSTTTCSSLPMVDCFRVAHPGDSLDGGGASGSVIDGLSTFGALTTIPGWQANHVTSVGDRLYAPSTDAGTPALPTTGGPNFDLHITYVCISVTGDARTGSTPPPSFADAPGLLTVDNHVTWMAVTHSGIVIRSTCEIQVDVSNFNGAGIFYAGDGAHNPVSNVNGSICRFPFVAHCGVGISIIGGDSNIIQFYGGELGALGISSDGFPGVGGCGIYDRSFGGCRFFGIIIETPAQRGIRSQGSQGSMYYGCHTEAGLPDHMDKSAVFGGQAASGFTTNSINMLVDTTLGGIQNLNLTATTRATGVTTRFSQASINSTSVDSRTTTDDVGLFFSTEYSQIGSGYFSYTYGQGLYPIWAYSNRLATYDGTNKIGAVWWLPQGAMHGQDKWYSFDDAASRDSFILRGGKRLPGDRIRIAGSASGFLVSLEQVVITAGWEGLTWTAHTGMTNSLVGFGNVIKPTTAQPAAQGLRFVCTTSGTTGSQEPTWNTTIGSTTANDGTVVWTCLGRSPTYGAVILDDPANARQNATTTDNTSNVVTANYTIPVSSTQIVEVTIAGNQTSGTGSPDSYIERRRFAVRCDASGNLTTVLADGNTGAGLFKQANANGAAWSANLNPVNGSAALGGRVEVRMTGDTGKTIHWSVCGGNPGSFGVS